MWQLAGARLANFLKYGVAVAHVITKVFKAICGNKESGGRRNTVCRHGEKHHAEVLRARRMLVADAACRVVVSCDIAAARRGSGRYAFGFCRRRARLCCVSGFSRVATGPVTAEMASGEFPARRPRALRNSEERPRAASFAGERMTARFQKEFSQFADYFPARNSRPAVP